MLHHLDTGQILTTTDAPASPLTRVYGRKVREVEILGWIINALKLIMTLAGRGVYDKSLRIIVNPLELIVGCKAGCHLLHRAAGSLKRLCRCASSNPDIIILEI